MLTCTRAGSPAGTLAALSSLRNCEKAETVRASLASTNCSGRCWLATRTSNV